MLKIWKTSLGKSLRKWSKEVKEWEIGDGTFKGRKEKTTKGLTSEA